MSGWAHAELGMFPGVRFDLRQLRRLQRGLRLLGDAMERIWVKAPPATREDDAA